MGETMRATLSVAAFLMAGATQAQTINPANWTFCAIKPLGASTVDYWSAVPAWTRNDAISKRFSDDPRVLANHGLCNEKYKRVVLCLPGWDEGPANSLSLKVCNAVVPRLIGVR
jgi:hypothetical protein